MEFLTQNGVCDTERVRDERIRYEYFSLLKKVGSRDKNLHS